MADLPGADELVERGQHLLDGGGRVEGVQLEQVDAVGAQTPQGVLGGPDQAGAGGACVAGAVAHGQPGLGGQQYAVAAAPHGRPQDGFRGAGGVDVGGVEECDPGVEAEVDQAACRAGVGVAPGPEERSPAAERAGAEAEDGNGETGSAELPVFHDEPPHVLGNALTERWTL